MTEPNKAEIINFIWWDVKFAFEQLKQQIEKGKYKFLFVHSNRKLFDIASLRYYFETTEIKNTLRINDIYNNCLKVIEIHNNEIVDIQTQAILSENSKDFRLANGGHMKISIPYECLNIFDNQISYVNEIGHPDFFNKKFDQYASDVFAKNCSQIVNDITFFIPDFFKQAIYIDIVSRLYTYKLYPNSQTNFDPYDFIDDRESQADAKGKAFYENILKEFEIHKIKKTSIRSGRFLYDDCSEFVNYCKQKITELDFETFDVKKLNPYIGNTTNNKETIISNYLAATEKILANFHVNREPDSESISIVTLGLHDFVKALRELYFSDNIEKDNYYELIFNVIGKANFKICKENFATNAYTDTWRSIDLAITTASSYVSELHFKETDDHFPFPKEQLLSSQQVEIKEDLLNFNNSINKIEALRYIHFSDIFSDINWDRYITALKKTTPPLLNNEGHFIGGAKKHKGVICSWIKDLQRKGFIKQNVNRSQLAKVLNGEIKDLNMGTDGKTFDNVSKEYEINFKSQLENLTK